MNRLTIAILATLALPATASAATLHELPFEQRKGPTGCLQATGAPGGLASLGTYSRTDSTTELRTVGGATESVSVGRLIDCAAVAEAPGGAAIVAGVAVARDGREYEAELRARLREPGGAFGEAVTLDEGFGAPVVAIAPSGAALVAWVTFAESRAEGAPRSLLVARRAPGGSFGAPETVATWRVGNEVQFRLQAALDAAGNATLLVGRELETERGGERLEAATAAPGAPFSRHRLATAPHSDAPPALSVAPDGWTLVAHRSRGEEAVPKLYERAPGAVGFSRVTLPAALPADESLGWSFGDPTVAVRSGGGAIVAWRTGPFETFSGVDAMTRETAGGFAVRRVALPVRLKDFSDDADSFPAFDVLDLLAGPPLGDDPVSLTVALAADGRVVLAWPAPAGRRPLAVQTARAAVGGLDGTFEPARTLGSPMRHANGVAAQFTADGRAAVAWTDTAAGGRLGRLHVALEGAPARAPEARPRVTVRAPAGQRLYPSEPVRIRVRCASACDLRTTVIGPHGPDGGRSLTRRRPGTHTLAAGTVDGLRPGQRRLVRVLVYASAPGGHRTAIRSFRIPVTGLRSLPVRPPRGVVARRHGDSIVVTWHTAAPARRQTFIVIGARSRNRPLETDAYALRDGAGRTRFAVRLRPVRPDRVRVVTVFAHSYDSGEDGPMTTVRVR